MSVIFLPFQFNEGNLRSKMGYYLRKCENFRKDCTFTLVWEKANKLVYYFSLVSSFFRLGKKDAKNFWDWARNIFIFYFTNFHRLSAILISFHSRVNVFLLYLVSTTEFTISCTNMFIFQILLCLNKLILGGLDS